MSRRHGVTLMEVLVAIFIMGIGMLALLVLFPVGVFRMAQAIQDDQCMAGARNANAIANQMLIRNDPWVLGDTTAVAAGASTPADPFVNPWPPNLVNALLPADPDGPSYPVYVDPMGYYAMWGQPTQYWLSSFGGTIPRRTTTFATTPDPFVAGVRDPNSSLTMRWTCLLDPLPFDPDATITYDFQPNPPGYLGATFKRDVRFSWAWMLKRPRTSDLSVVDMAVVVYNNNRPILSSPINEYLYVNGVDDVQFDVKANSITIDVAPGNIPTGNIPAPARPGDWLLDASYVPDATSFTKPGGPFATVNGYFYRVVNVTQNSESSFTYELEQPLRNMAATTAINPGTGQPYATWKVMFLEGVAEVFEKGPGWRQ